MKRIPSFVLVIVIVVISVFIYVIIKLNSHTTPEDIIPSSPQDGSVKKETIDPEVEKKYGKEIAQASSVFKIKFSDPDLRDFTGRLNAGNILFPRLHLGMTKQEVEELLGKPDFIGSRKDGITVWKYTIWYSYVTDIYFDAKDKLQYMTAMASPESDQRDNPTGEYEIGKKPKPELIRLDHVQK